MTDSRHGGHLGAAYDSRSPDDVAALYDRWADSYEADMSTAGYRHPAICLALLARHLPAGSARVLDAGCGTGLLGDWLKITGYPHAEGLDISKGMLAVAARKGAYDALHNLALGGPLPFADGQFAGVVSAGVFTTGHVGPEGLDELIRICSGVIVLTVKVALWQTGFGQRVDELAKLGTVEIAEMTEPYVSMPGETGTTPSRGVVLRVKTSP